MRVYLAGLEAAHLDALEPGYALAAQGHGDVLVSFFTYTGQNGKSRLSQVIVPPPKENPSEQNDLPLRPHRRPH